MIIKQPAAFDTSYYELILDFAAVSPRPALVCTKATEGSGIRDSKFLTYWADLKQDGIRRACYHFHRKAIDAVLQALNFINAVKAGGVDPQDYFVLDIEEGGETPAQIIAWLDKVEQNFPNTIMLYSTANLLSQLAAKCTPAQLTRLKKYPLWIAWYPLNPDDFSALPASFYPAGLGPVWMWQYSESALVPGIVGEVDANWLSPTFRAILGIDAPAPLDVMTTPHDGIVRFSGSRYGWKFVFDVITPAKVIFDTVIPSQLSQVSAIAKNGAVKGSNCGEWNDRYPNKPYYLQPINYTVCNGKEIIPRTSPQPSLMFLNDGSVILDHKPTANVKHAFTGLRYLIYDGVINPDFVDNGEGHSRKIFAVNTKGQLLELSTEGVYPNQGWTLTQCLNFLLEKGAVRAADFGGGGDATAWADGKLLLKPENAGGLERYLPNIFLVYPRGIMNGKAKESLGKTPSVRTAPDISGTKVYTLAAGATVDYVTEVAGSVVKTDKWLKLADGNYVNYVVSGVTYFTIITPPTPDPVTPPVTVKTVSLTIEPTAGTVFTWLYSDGSTKKETA